MTTTILLTFTPVILLVLIPLIMVAIRFLWADFAFHWLLAVATAFLAWVLTILSRSHLPQAINLGEWIPEDLVQYSPTLLVDQQSWVYAVALVSLALAVLLTEVARAPEADWQAWSGTLMLAALGLLSVFAATPLTLLLAWAALDFTETAILLLQVPLSQQRERVVVALSARIGGMILLLWAGLIASKSGESLTFNNIPSEVAIYLLLSAGLRLGVLPPHRPFIREPQLRRGLGTMIRLVPVASALVLLTRVAPAGVPVKWVPYLLSVTALPALYGGYSWFRAENELDGRPYWILGVGSLALVCAVLALPEATTAWSLALLFSGGLIFLISVRHRSLLILSLFAILAVSGLPFTPTWDGSQLYGIYQFESLSGFRFLSWILIIVYAGAQAVLLLGLTKHALRVDEVKEIIERWVWMIYPVGLGVLPLTHFGLAWWTGLGISDTMVSSSPLSWEPGWWGGLLSIGLLGLMILWMRRGPSIPQFVGSSLDRLFSLEWLYRIIWWFYRMISRSVTVIDRVFEGDGGLLWALLIVTLILTFLSARNGGG